MNNHIQFSVPVSILREGKQFVAYSPALDLSTAAKSYQQAVDRFHEAAELFFEEIVKKNTWEEVLQELGWERVRTKWMPPMVVAHETQAVRMQVR
ncbi:MAG: hypothetical protein V1707_00300 [bacterium]